MNKVHIKGENRIILSIENTCDWLKLLVDIIQYISSNLMQSF